MPVIHLSIETPIRTTRSPAERFGEHDRGLIWCWEQGRQEAEKDHQLAANARNGEIPLIRTWKQGANNYHAYWMGLRGEDLVIDPEEGLAMQCRKTKKWWAFGPEGEWKVKLQLWLDNRHRLWKKAGDS